MPARPLLLIILLLIPSACGPTEALPPAGALFTEVTAQAGLGEFRHETGAFGQKWFPESMGSGCGFIDYDGDGWLDIVLAGGGAWPESSLETTPPAIWLYRNLGDGRFALQTRDAGLAEVDAYSLGFAVGDYDNDGDADLFLSTLTVDRLFRNEGGHFVDVSAASGIAGFTGWSSSAAFFDADRDGWLDLYVGYYVEWTPETDLFCSHDGDTKGYCTPETYSGLPGRFYHNNGDGTFTDWTRQVGFAPAHGTTLGVLVFDFDRDDWPDVMLANDTRPGQLFVNDGQGRFVERGAESGVAYDDKGRARAGMGVDAGVVDSTFQQTIFIGNFSREMISVYRYAGNGYFADRAAVSRIGRKSLLTLTFGLAVVDIDLDGHLDLVAANGHVQPDIELILENVRYAEPAHLFLNRGDGTFDDVADSLGGPAAVPIVARGMAAGDYDNDGDPDLLIVENGRGAHLWRNEANSNRYLKLYVEGTQSNRPGLGTRVVAVAGGHRMERSVRSGSSYLAASEQVALFGLGNRERVDSLYVFWPSGRRDRFADVEGGRGYLLVEGTGTLVPRGSPVGS
jgi:hypothetical protein